MVINIILENTLYREKFINNTNLFFKLVLNQIGFIETINTTSFKKDMFMTVQILKNLHKFILDYYVIS